MFLLTGHYEHLDLKNDKYCRKFFNCDLPCCTFYIEQLVVNKKFQYTDTPRFMPCVFCWRITSIGE